MLRACLTHLLLAVIFSPLLLGVITKTKAFLTGRKGAPFLQPYYDLGKLFHKGAVYSVATTWVFRVGPMISLAAVLAASLFLPFGSLRAPMGFPGDVVLFVYLLALGRFFTVLAALDTGSSFEGMGASREVTFSTLSELTFFTTLVILAVISKSFSLSGMLGASQPLSWTTAGPILFLAAVSFFLVLLAENARIPFGDPNTHLELTMIHEVMVLDHSGPDLAFIFLGSSLKLFLFVSFLVSVLIPARTGRSGIAVFLGGVLGVAVVIGVVESVMARLRLNRIPHLLTIAFALSTFGLVVLLSRGI